MIKKIFVHGTINPKSILNEISAVQNVILSTAAPVCLARRKTTANAKPSKYFCSIFISHSKSHVKLFKNNIRKYILMSGVYHKAKHSSNL